MDSEWTRVLGSGWGSTESEVEGRNRPDNASEGHGKRARLAPGIAVE